MVLLEQIAALLDFMESQPELALGHFNRSVEGRSRAKRLWVECAQILNSIAADCPNKSPTEWRSFYNEFKCKVMKKIKIQKREMSATGGGPAKKIILTPLQERLYNILGRDIGEPLAGVRHNPLPPDNPAMEVDVSASASTTNNSFSILDTSAVPGAEVIDLEPLIISYEQEIVGNQPPSDLQPLSDLQPSELQPSSDIQPPASPDLHPPQARPRYNQLPRRRRRPTRHAEERDHAALEASQARLEQIEARNAEATLAQAQAIEKLAAAVDKLGTATNQAADRLVAAIEKVGEIISLVVEPPLKKKRRKLTSSESESEEI